MELKRVSRSEHLSDSEYQESETRVLKYQDSEYRVLNIGLGSE